MKLDDLKATLVSIMPFPIDEHKVGVYPGDYHLEASTDGRPHLLVVDNAFHYVYLGEDRGHMKVNIPAHELAAAVIYDYANSLFCISDSARPGVFWVPGTYRTPEEIEVEFADRLEAARALQNNWFMALVKLADDDWQKYHRHSVISSHQLFAAKALGLEREWLVVMNPAVHNILCPACKSAIHPEATVCPHCQTKVLEFVR